MASVDALTLVNRVRRRAQLQSVSSIGEQRSDLILDLVNEAKNEVLETTVWPFDVRHDGLLVTKPTFSSDTGASVAGGSQSPNLEISNFSGSLSDLSGDVVTRAVVTDADSYGNTAFRVESVEDIGGGSTRLVLETDWPGVTGSLGGRAWRTFAGEYLLPTTVRSVLAVRFQEEEVRLRMIDPALEFDQLIPRPLDEINDDTRWVGVGGYAEGTYNADGQSSPSERKLRAIVYPIPESKLVFHYSYVARHPDLSSATDTIEDVPSPVVDEIVHEAYARYQLTDAGNDAESGAINRRVARRSRESKRRESRHDPFRRKVLHTVDGRGGPSIRDRLISPFGRSEL